MRATTGRRHGRRPERYHCTRSTTSRPGRGPGHHPAQAPLQAGSPSGPGNLTLQVTHKACRPSAPAASGGRLAAWGRASRRPWSQRGSDPAVPWTSPALSLPTVRPGPGLTGHMPWGRRSSSGPVTAARACCQQQAFAGCLGPGWGSRPFDSSPLRLLDTQPARAFSLASGTAASFESRKS